MPFLICPSRRFSVQCVARSFLLLLIFLLAACTIPSSAPPPETGQAINGSKPNLPGYVIKRVKKAPYVLVLVHGITGDGISSWTSEKGTYWPKLMGDDPAFDNFDIYVYEYPTSRFGECLSVSDLATNMQTHLRSDSVFENHKKVVLFAHSMGGLIVRTFLLRYREAADKVPMLFFFATPSAGSRKANLASVLPTCNQVEDLRTLDVNSFLEKQLSDWLSANFRDRIVSHCAVETHASYGSLTVERSSATLLCTREPLPLPTAHSEIVKPDSTSDLAHKFVKNALSDLFQGNPPVMPLTQAETKRSEAITCGQPLVGLTTKPKIFVPEWIPFLNTLRDEKIIHDFQTLMEIRPRLRKYGGGPEEFRQANFTLDCFEMNGFLKTETLDTPSMIGGEFKNRKIMFLKPIPTLTILE